MLVLPTLSSLSCGIDDRLIRVASFPQIAAIQHSIVLPTTAPLKCQREAIFEKVAEMIGQCAAVDANIICLPETWSVSLHFDANHRKLKKKKLNFYRFPRYSIRILYT